MLLHYRLNMDTLKFKERTLDPLQGKDNTKYVFETKYTSHMLFTKCMLFMKLSVCCFQSIVQYLE
jgi:hypothetical protein